MIRYVHFVTLKGVLSKSHRPEYSKNVIFQKIITFLFEGIKSWSQREMVDNLDICWEILKNRMRSFCRWLYKIQTMFKIKNKKMRYLKLMISCLSQQINRKIHTYCM